LLTTSYSITGTRIFFKHGIWPVVTQSLAIDHLDEIQILEHDDPGFSALVLNCIPHVSVRGFDFDTNKVRDTASIEKLREPRKVVGLLSGLKGTKIRTSLKKRPIIPKDESYMLGTLSVLITRYVGSLYQLLCLLAIMYIVDVKFLSPYQVYDKTVHSERVPYRYANENMEFLTTDKGYRYKTYREGLGDNLPVLLSVSRIFREVTAIQYEGRPPSESHIPRLSSIRLYIFLITYGIVSYAGYVMVISKGRLDRQLIPFAFAAPVIFISFTLWLCFGRYW
jgi:hypothetical protein